MSCRIMSCNVMYLPLYITSYHVMLYLLSFYISLSPDSTISTISLSPFLSHPPSLASSVTLPHFLSPCVPPFLPPSLPSSLTLTLTPFFYPFTAIRWHLSQSDVDDVAVYIPMSLINDDGGNFLTVLKAIPHDEVLRKQEAIRRIGEWTDMV